MGLWRFLCRSNGRSVLIWFKKIGWFWFKVWALCEILSFQKKVDCRKTLTKLRHCRSRHFCRILFGPPNFFMSCGKRKRMLGTRPKCFFSKRLIKLSQLDILNRCKQMTGVPHVIPSTRNQGSVSISMPDIRPGIGPFCYGQITWEDNPTPGQTVHRAYWNRPLTELTDCTVSWVMLPF